MKMSRILKFPNQIQNVFVSIICFIFLHPAAAWSSVQVQLVEKIELINLQGLLTVTEGGWRTGFIKRGREVYFGSGCWSYDIEEKKVKCNFPRDLTQVLLSNDGEVLFGCHGDHITPAYYVNTITGNSKLVRVCPMWGGVSSLHPNKLSHVSSMYIQNRLVSVELDQLFPYRERNGPRFRDGETFSTLIGFTGDGKHIVMRDGTDIGLVDTKTLKLLPKSQVFDSKNFKSPNYLGNSDILIFNSNVSLLAGQFESGRVSQLNPLWRKDESESNRTYLWDQEHKRFLWKYKDLGTPIAFSANSQYLLTGGRIVEVATGNVVQAGINGVRGKFSPDGRSLVTMDDEAFYIYTLPKESPAVFGVIPVAK